MLMPSRRLRQFVLSLSTLALTASAFAQQPASPWSAPLRLTLTDALERARKNSVVYQGAVTDARLAHEDKKQATAALLPSVNYNNSAIYTQGTGVNNSVIFIANNGVHEYISQADIHEALDVAGIAEARRADAAAASARATRHSAPGGCGAPAARARF